jgi:phosphoglucosamine mutase
MKEGWQLGGESSGHVICLDLTPTGDGIITALQILLAMKWSGKNLHQLKSGMIKTIQITKNIPCDNNKIILQNNDVQTLVALTHNKLQPDGRVLLRASGTEPVLRLTVEGKERKIIEEVVHKLFDEISRIISNY